MKKLTLLILLLANTSISAQDTPSPAEARKIIAQLRNKMGGIYLNFKGVESYRKVQIKEVDSNSGKLLNTTRLGTKHKEFFYNKPVQKILQLQINGINLAPEKATNQPVQKPAIPVFDSQGHKNYNLRITGIKKIGKKPCYRLEITPLKQTPRHLKGEMFFTKKGLIPLRFNGGLAALPTGLKSLSFSISFKQKGKWSVAAAGSIRIRIYIPILQPDRRLHIIFNATGHRLLAK